VLCRTYAKEAGTEGWTVAAEDDCKGIIEDILQPRPQEEKEEQQQHAAGEGSDEEQPVQGSSSTRSSSSSSSRSSSSKSSKPKGPEKEMVRYFRSRISAMKNFVESTHRWVAGWAQGGCGAAAEQQSLVMSHQGVPSTARLP
jgi:hypothetical protein